MAPPRGSSVQGGGGGGGGVGGKVSHTGRSIKSSIRRSSRSSVQSNMLYASTTEDEPESEAESSVDEHRRKDTEYHERIQLERLKIAEERRAREKKERELEKQKIAARQAEKKKGKGAAGDEGDLSSVSESDVDNASEARRSQRKTKPQPEIQQVESKLLGRMKRFSQLPKEIWEKRVKRKSKTQPPSQPEPEADTGTGTTPASEPQPSSDESKENVEDEEMETPPAPVADDDDEDVVSVPVVHSSKAKRVSTAAAAVGGSIPVRASPRKNQNAEDSFANKALLTSTPYPGGTVAWKNGPSLPDPDMSPVTPQNKDDRGSRKVIHTQKVKTHSQPPQSRIPVPLPAKLSDMATPTPSGSGVPSSAEIPSAEQRDAELADNEETPSSPRRSPRKSVAPPPPPPSSSAQKNGTFNVTHGFVSRPKVVRTPVKSQSQVPSEDKNKDTSVTSYEEDSDQSPSPDQLPNTSQSQEHHGTTGGPKEKRSANAGARLRRSMKAAALEDDSSSDDEQVIPLPLRNRTALSLSRPKPLDSPTVTTGTASQPSRLSKKVLPPSRLSQAVPKEPQQQARMSQSQRQGQSQHGGGDGDTQKNVDEAAGGGGGGGVSRTSAIHQSPVGRPEKSGLGLDRRSKQHTTTATTTSAPAVESSSSSAEDEEEENAPPENIQEDDDFAEKPRAAPSDRRTRARPQPASTAEPEKLPVIKAEAEPLQKTTRTTRATPKEVPVPVVEPSTSTAALSQKKRKAMVVAPEVPEVDGPFSESEEENSEPQTQPTRRVPARSTRATAKAIEAEPQTKQPSVVIPLKRGRKTKVVAPVPPPPHPPQEILAAANADVDNELVEREDRVASPSPPRRSPSPSSQLPLTQRAVPVPSSSPMPSLPLTQRVLPSSPKSASETEQVVDEPPKKVIKTKKTSDAKTPAVPPPLKAKPKKKPAKTLPAASKKVGRLRRQKSQSRRAPSPVPVPKESSSSDEELIQEPSPQKSPGGRPSAPAPTVKELEPQVIRMSKRQRQNRQIGGDTAKNSDENEQQAVEGEGAVQRSPSPGGPSPLTQRVLPSSPKSASETEQVVDDPPPKKFFKTKKLSGIKTPAVPPSKSKSKKKPAVTLAVPKRGRLRKQKSPSLRVPSPIPQSAFSSDEEIAQEPPPSQKNQSDRPTTPISSPPRLPEPHHRGRPVTASPSIPESPRVRPISASQPISESYQRGRISIQQTSKLLPASQPLPGTSAAAAASRSMTSQSSSLQSMRTKETRRRSIFDIARAATDTESPPRKKSKKKQAEKTPERYVGSDVFGNYHMVKDPEMLKIITEEKPDHGLDQNKLGQLSLRINHFLEDFFTQHCEETPQPNGFIPFLALKTGLEEQCLVEEDCSPDHLMEQMKKDFPKQDWKRSEGILYPSRNSKNQDTDGYLLT